MEIKVNNEGQPGFQEVIGILDGEEVISLADGMRNPDNLEEYVWRVTSSRTVPGDLDRAYNFAVLVSRCTKKVEKLNLLATARTGIKGSYFYDVDDSEVLHCDKIEVWGSVLKYIFQVKNGTQINTQQISSHSNLDDFLENKLLISEEEANEYIVEGYTNSIQKIQDKIDVIRGNQ